MAERLPLFPLSLVLFPGVLLPLHIFEHRYRLLVARAVERSEPFGVVLIKSGQEVGAPADPHSVGTSARIVTFDPQPDGRSLLIARGERRFAIERVIADEEPYLVGSVRWLDETEGDGLLAAAQAAAGAYREYLTAAGALLEASGQPRPEPLAAGTAPADLAYRIASDLPIPDEDRQRLLEQETAADRLMHELPLLARETELLRTVLAGLRAPGPGDRPN